MESSYFVVLDLRKCQLFVQKPAQKRKVFESRWTEAKPSVLASGLRRNALSPLDRLKYRSTHEGALRGCFKDSGGFGDELRCFLSRSPQLLANFIKNISTSKIITSNPEKPSANHDGTHSVVVKPAINRSAEAKCCLNIVPFMPLNAERTPRDGAARMLSAREQVLMMADKYFIDSAWTDSNRDTWASITA